MAAMQTTKWFIWLIAFALIVACVPSLAPQVPTVDPGAINTIIVQTANAAASQTAAALPSDTPTLTPVPTRNTATPTPTATATVIFLFFSPTPLVSPTFAPSGKSSDHYACQVVKVSPPNGTVFTPRQDFDAYWVVKNIGKRNWDRTEVHYAYLSGDKIHIVSGYDLSETLASGNILDLGVDMQAPKDPGTYTTTWTLQTANKTFCPLTLTIKVKEASEPTETKTTATP